MKLNNPRYTQQTAPSIVKPTMVNESNKPVEIMIKSGYFWTVYIRNIYAMHISKIAYTQMLAASVTDDTTRQRNRNKKQKKQTILTGYKRTGNDIHNRQRVSRHSLPTLLYFLFSPPHIFLIQFYANAQTAHWLLPQLHKPTHRQKPKSRFLPMLL